MPFLIFLSGNGNSKPFFQTGIDLLPVFRADVIAMRTVRRFSGHGAPAVSGGQVVTSLIKRKNLFQASPNRVVLPVPGKLVCVDQPAGGHRADNDPGEKTVSCREAEIARGFPAPAAGVVE